jgi:hypothetical protein
MEWNSFVARLKERGVYCMIVVESVTDRGVFEIYLTSDRCFQRENIKIMEKMPEVVKIEPQDG